MIPAEKWRQWAQAARERGDSVAAYSCEVSAELTSMGNPPDKCLFYARVTPAQYEMLADVLADLPKVVKPECSHRWREGEAQTVWYCKDCGAISPPREWD